MPEGPELHLAAKFITTIGERTLFGGKVVKSAVSTKNPEVEWDSGEYRVAARSRGKELKVALTEEVNGGQGRTLNILFRFGMSGCFKYTPVSELHKHAHLQFYTIGEPTPMVLSFVDYRRFGRWEVEGDWGRDRGPDPIWEYQAFRANVLENLKAAAFNRPICEAMLNQKFFNGIGNYLRAEILYRCSVRPFDEAREVLSELKPFSQWFESEVMQEDAKPSQVKQEDAKPSQVKQEDAKPSQVQPDLLDLCHTLAWEVVNLSGGGKGYNVDPDAKEEDYAAFREWLQCYYQDGMQNMVDHNRRTMWFTGEPGRLKPKDASSRNKVQRKKKTQKKEENEKEAKEQNCDSGYQESVAKTKKRPSRAKATTEPKKTASKKSVNGQMEKTKTRPSRAKATKEPKKTASKKSVNDQMEKTKTNPKTTSPVKIKEEDIDAIPGVKIKEEDIDAIPGVKIKEEDIDAIPGVKIKEEDIDAIPGATKMRVKCEDDNTVPKRRSTSECVCGELAILGGEVLTAAADLGRQEARQRLGTVKRAALVLRRQANVYRSVDLQNIVSRVDAKFIRLVDQIDF
ncbi:Endonuclease 8-like 1 [Chionoecetes opilio]|uniref:Endonuclease 8-like 1 n=1 Tax=Chionoecetes opilio TaxID=41210 RepID=A0A8J4YHW0_CHIOP|nr:Endonuclease 8-like 1 [Chionoecetes opilio]